MLIAGRPLQAGRQRIFSLAHELGTTLPRCEKDPSLSERKNDEELKRMSSVSRYHASTAIKVYFRASLVDLLPVFLQDFAKPKSTLTE